ncbi:MAG: oligosaccharide flippase family protein [Candidatus Syntropharchaeia archaeon]
MAFLRRATGIFATSIFSMILAMAAGIIVARRLGPDLRGYYGLAAFSVSLLISFGQLGIGTAIAYFSGKEKYPRSQILAFLIVSSFVAGTMLAFSFYMLYPKIPGKFANLDKRIMIIALSATPFFFLQNFTSRFLLSMLKVKQSNIANLVRTILYLLLVIILLWWLKGKLLASVVCYTLSIVISSVLAVVGFTRDIKPDFHVSRNLLKEAFSFGFKAYIINVLNFLNFRLDIFLIQHFLQTNELSFYQIAVTLSEKLWYIPHALSTVLFPTLLAQKEISTKLTEKICRHNLFVMLILTVPILIFAKPAIGIFYGKAYLPTATAIYSVLIGILLFPIFKFLSSDFIARNRLGIGILASSIGIAVNLTANLLLIPNYGIIGAGIATSISYSLMAVILVGIYARTYNIPYRNLIIIKRDDLEDYRGFLSKIRNKGITQPRADDIPIE